jgi:predicted 3-demethylubiquinone-9 3-methyltransferase (glyoxalase superfamily)
MTVDFGIQGQKFVALNGGPVFKINEAISFQVMCETQRDAEGGGSLLRETLQGRRRKGAAVRVAERQMRRFVANRVLKMKKLDINTLEKAYK